MNILVIGGGGREHALVWKLAQSSHVTQMWCAPGNAGIQQERTEKTQSSVECVNIGAEDLPRLLAFAQEKNVDFTVVGPDNPLALGIVVPMGPMIYRVAYQPLAHSGVLVLLIVSVGVHFAMTGLGLLFFGAEGFRNPSFLTESWSVGPLNITGQVVIIFTTALLLIAALWMFFERTLFGKALRATAVNRTGARLMGISTHAAGQFTFLLAAGIGAVSGLLIGPTTTVFYDSGFLIGLKGFVAAVVAGLSSYPGAMVGALFVGVVESFGSFWASAFKEVIVFTMILPILLWRSLSSGHSDEEH